MFNFLAGPFSAAIESNFGTTGTSWLKPIAQFLDSLIVPITVIALIAGGIWIVWLGVQLAKAESEDAQKKAKKAIINVAIAFVSVLVMLWVIAWFAANFSSIIGQQPLTSIESK